MNTFIGKDDENQKTMRSQFIRDTRPRTKDIWAAKEMEDEFFEATKKHKLEEKRLKNLHQIGLDDDSESMMSDRDKNQLDV